MLHAHEIYIMLNITLNWVGISIRISNSLQEFALQLQIRIRDYF